MIHVHFIFDGKLIATAKSPTKWWAIGEAVHLFGKYYRIEDVCTHVSDDEAVAKLLLERIQ